MLCRKARQTFLTFSCFDILRNMLPGISVCSPGFRRARHSRELILVRRRLDSSVQPDPESGLTVLTIHRLEIQERGDGELIPPTYNFFFGFFECLLFTVSSRQSTIDARLRFLPLPENQRLKFTSMAAIVHEFVDCLGPSGIMGDTTCRMGVIVVHRV